MDVRPAMDAADYPELDHAAAAYYKRLRTWDSLNNNESIVNRVYHSFMKYFITQQNNNSLQYKYICTHIYPCIPIGCICIHILLYKFLIHTYIRCLFKNDFFFKFGLKFGLIEKNPINNINKTLDMKYVWSSFHNNIRFTY